MTYSLDALDEMETPIIQLETLSRSLRQTASLMNEKEHEPSYVVAILQNLANHIQSIHDELLRHYEAIPPSGRLKAVN